MKKTTFAFIFTVLITFSCIFASCNLNKGTAPTDETDTATSENHTSMIRDLEDQLLELKQNQYISNSQRAEEIAKLEALIEELRQNGDEKDSESGTNTSSKDEANTDTPSTVSKFIYTISGEEATLTGYTGNDALLTIPSYIDGYKITAISDDCFASTALSSVIIPDTVTKIGWFAFRECSALKTITIPNSVSSIGYSAFPQDSNGFTIICASDSFAAKYADSYGINTTLI